MMRDFLGVRFEAIVNQVFEPGTQIKIDTLVRQLNMSNTPIREALMRLTGERLVKQESNRGFTVTGILTSEELQELFEVRYLIEIHSLETDTITDEVVQQLASLAKMMDSSADGVVYKDFRDFLKADHLFHQTIVSLPENSLLLKSWEALNVHLHLSRLYTGSGLFDRDYSTNEHSQIVAALRQGDRVAAVDRLRHHIRSVRIRMLEFLQADQQPLAQDEKRNDKARPHS